MNASDLSLNNNNNNQLSQVMCRQSTYIKQSSHPKSCSAGTLAQPLTVSSMSLLTDKKSIRRKAIQRRVKYVESCQISSIVKTKLLKVKNCAKHFHYCTQSLANRVTQCFESINRWTDYKPMCYLIQLIARCCRPWIKSNKAIAGKPTFIALTF